jgi:hypothetical protein
VGGPLESRERFGCADPADLPVSTLEFVLKAMIASVQAVSECGEQFEGPPSVPFFSMIKGGRQLRAVPVEARVNVSPQTIPDKWPAV